MPLLHQDTTRAGCNERPRSLVDFVGYDPPPRSEPNPIPKDNHRSNDILIQEDWAWESPGSPPAAQTPRALVPAACFPPRHTSAYNSYSESARPGASWDPGSGNSTEITDLVASLKALAVPSKLGDTSLQRVETSVQLRLKYDTYDVTNVNPDAWQSEPLPTRDTRVARRASFGGVVSSREGEVVRWSGVLPARSTDPGGGGYSPKVFLGGLPWDIGESALMAALDPFHPVRVEWPGREQADGNPRGFAYMTFESERRVRELLAASRRVGQAWYYRVSSRKIRHKDVQVIPWAVCDSSWVAGAATRLDPARTVFVGALHGMLSALALATICNDLFSGVVYASIDTDKNKYPIGSGRVTFDNVRSYIRAISANYVEIRTDKFTKKVQIDPYLEESICSVCQLCQGPYFCRVPGCFRYFCRSCWAWQHPKDEHKPLMRVSRGQPYSPTSPVPNGNLKAITYGPFNGSTDGSSHGLSGSNGSNGMTNGHGHLYQSDEGLSGPNIGYDKNLTNGHMGYENDRHEYGTKSAYSDINGSNSYQTDNRVTNSPNMTYENDIILTSGPKMGYPPDDELTNGHHSDKYTNGSKIAYKDCNGSNIYKNDSSGLNMYSDPNMYKENGFNKYRDANGPNVYRDCNGPNTYQTNMYKENGPNKYHDSNGPTVYRDCNGSNKYKDSSMFKENCQNKYKDAKSIHHGSYLTNGYHNSNGPTNGGYRSSTSDQGTCNGSISSGSMRNGPKMMFQSPISPASDYSVYSSSASPNGNSDGSGSPTSPKSSSSASSGGHDGIEWR